MKQSLAAALLALLLSGCGARAVPTATDCPEQRTLHALMYHSILKDPDRAGKYILSPESFEADVVYLLSNGYSPVTVRALVAFVDGEGTLPDHPVLLTFDDGYLNNLTYVLPILEKYDIPALISVVGEYTQRYSEAPDPNPNYAYVSWEEVAQLAGSGRVEIGNHTFRLHGQLNRRGSARRQGESAADYERIFLDDVGALQEALSMHTGAAPLAFAYPYGIIDPQSKELLKQLGFRVTLACSERAATLTAGDPNSLFGLGRFNRPSGVSTEAFMERVL